MNLWEKADGKESMGWITMAVSESDGVFHFEYAGELGDDEFSNTCWHGDEERLYSLLGSILSTIHNRVLAGYDSIARVPSWKTMTICISIRWETWTW